MISGVYKISSITKPERCYIGSTKNLYKRWEQHLVMLNDNKHHSKKLQRHYNKYGKADFQFTLIVGCDINDLISTEQYFIDIYKPYFNGSLKAFNNGGYEQSDAEKQRKREAMLGENNPNYGREFSEEHRKRIGEAHKGLAGPMKGRKQTDEAKLKMSKARKGKHYSPETEFKKGQTPSEENRRKVSEALKGKEPWNKGIPMTEEAKEKLSKTNTGRKCKNYKPHLNSEETKHKMSEARLKYYAIKKLFDVQQSNN
jgi:group I intron endonuclease